jgi:hypothetical protein
MAIPDAAGRMDRDRKAAAQGELGDISFVKLNDSFHTALLNDAADIYFPGRSDKNARLVSEAIITRERNFSRNLETEFLVERLSAGKLRQIVVMYLKFVLVYAVVMLLTYYGVQTLGTWLFVYERRQSGEQADEFGNRIVKFLSRFAGAIITMILFSPAYVIAYSIRTKLNTDTVLFMIVLGVVSNGLLIVYAAKFRAFLEVESRKGYIDTAVVKNLNSLWSRKDGGITITSILKPRKCFSGHVFEHIYRNAVFQYLSTIKEQAAFLVTGLIIIEMALNIQGHLCYEMLREMMYGNTDIVVVILLLIFYTVKVTEIATDVAISRRNIKYANIN